MTSAERMCMVAARSEGLLADFVLVFLVRWGLKYLGLDYMVFEPIMADVESPFVLADLAHPLSLVFYASMYFASGLPEVIFAAVWVVYATVALTMFGQTLGMRQAGIRLVSANGSRASFLRVLVRQVVAPISSIAWIGFWPVMFSDRASALHDLASGTRVVYAKKPEARESAEQT